MSGATAPPAPERRRSKSNCRLACAEIIDGEEVPAAEVDAPAVCALTEVAIITAALDGDLFYYGKELWQAIRAPTPSRCRLNLPDILRAERHLERPRALERTVELCDQLTLRFLQLREQVLPGASRPLCRYIEHLPHLILGNLERGLRDGRHPGAVATSVTFTQTAPPPVRRPSPRSPGGGIGPCEKAALAPLQRPCGGPETVPQLSRRCQAVRASLARVRPAGWVRSMSRVLLMWSSRRATLLWCRWRRSAARRREPVAQ